jgi:predicted nucleic acid-binding protein
MPVKEIIIDSSPLIALFRSHQAPLLAQLFTNIWVPNAVWEEVSNKQIGKCYINHHSTHQRKMIVWQKMSAAYIDKAVQSLNTKIKRAAQ